MKTGSLSGLILSGTAGRNLAAGAGKVLARALRLVGQGHRAQFSFVVHHVKIHLVLEPHPQLLQGPSWRW